MTENEKIARRIVEEINVFCQEPENPEGPDSNTHLIDLIIDALNAKDDSK